MGCDGVDRVGACDLTVTSAPWHYASDHVAAIEQHWQHRLTTNPGYFNGAIHVLALGEIAGDGNSEGVFKGEFLRTDFKSYLHWREHGFPSAGVKDAFGSAIVRGCDGAVLLGLQRRGNINAGLAYLPGGFIDQRDVSADGAIDIGASIDRELAEETGLTTDAIAPQPGFRIVRSGPLVSMAREYRSALDSDALRARILEFLSADPNPELADIVIVRQVDAYDPALIPAYTRFVLTDVLGPERG